MHQLRNALDRRAALVSLIGMASFMALPARAQPVVGRRASSANGVQIAYDILGTGEPALVLIHGWCCDRTYWSAQLPALSHRFRLVTLDLAGHGQSGAGRSAWTIDAFGEDVVAVVTPRSRARSCWSGIRWEATSRSPPRGGSASG